MRHLAPSSLSLLSLFAVSVPIKVWATLDNIVKLPYGSFQGQVDQDLIQYLGIPFALPPTGEHRFGLPQPPLPFNGIREAKTFGSACPQQDVSFPKEIPFQSPALVNISEDCLFVNVVRPANIQKGKYLPVLVYIYGGGFQVGDTSMYPGDTVVNRSIALNEPVIFVSANYRLNAFGFLGGKEVKEAGITNAGLYDQLFALEWIRDNIAAFGGDPKKVSIWGESAGAISVGLHLILKHGYPGGLFSGAIMQSGSPLKLPDVLDMQRYFDDLVSATNCTDAKDRLGCLRAIPYSQLIQAVNREPNLFSYQGLNMAWRPMIDGILIPRSPLQILQSGEYARVPFITGDCEDEGTMFTFPLRNITTNAQYIEYIKTQFFPNISDAELTALAEAYPDDITQGSPFNTGTANALSPQFKRLAAFLGDMAFQAPRRFLLEIASKTQPAYSFRFLRTLPTPIPGLGAFHSFDLQEFIMPGNSTDYIGMDALIYFAHKGNPNAPENSISLLRNISWEKWSSSCDNSPLLTFLDPPPLVNITSDTYRSKPMKLLLDLLQK